MTRQSRADFYVRSFAVLSLGCLAAAAAFVDSSSAALNLPEVISLSGSDAVPVVETVVEVPGLAPSPLRLTPILRAPSAVAVVRAMDVIPAMPLSTRRVRVRWTDPVVKVTPLPVMDAALPLPQVELAAAPALDDEPAWQPLPAATIALDRPDDGLFSEMLKKTSSSMGKAGSSMVGAFRSISTVVKRAF